MTTLAHHVERAGAASRTASAGAGYPALAGALSLAAGMIHLTVVPQHLQEAHLLGVFFLVIGLGQLALAVVLQWTTRPWLLVSAIFAHVGLLLLYVVSRTADLPFVPAHDVGHTVEHLPIAGGVGNGIPVFPGSRIEEVTVLDLGCQLVELGLVLVLTGLLPQRTRARMGTLMLCAGLAALAGRATGLLV